MSDTLTNPENVTASGGHRDAITATASPRPWRITHPGEIEDANGNFLYNLRDCVGGGVDEANAALIVDAVNNIDRLRDELDVERSQHATDIEQVEYHEEHHRKSLEAECDRLRDLVRRLVNQFGSRATYDDDAALLREARAAIGENEK